MIDQHPITPTSELVQQWIEEDEGGPGAISRIATRAAQWGADQELEACCEWLDHEYGYDAKLALKLRAVRRPKPPSLKRVALLQLDTLNADLGLEDKGIDLSQIRRALEALPDD